MDRLTETTLLVWFCLTDSHHGRSPWNCDCVDLLCSLPPMVLSSLHLPRTFFIFVMVSFILPTLFVVSWLLWSHVCPLEWPIYSVLSELAQSVSCTLTFWKESLTESDWFIFVPISEIFNKRCLICQSLTWMKNSSYQWSVEGHWLVLVRMTFSDVLNVSHSITVSRVCAVESFLSLCDIS